MRIASIRKPVILVNVALLMAVIYLLVVAIRRSHAVDGQLLLAFVPPLSALVVTRYRNRVLGFVAVLSNGLLFLGGVFSGVAAAFGAGARGSAGDQLVLPAMAVVCMSVGLLNMTTAWRLFPPVQRNSSTPCAAGGHGARDDA